MLIPFIDEARLISAMAPLLPKMTADEVSRNSHGPMFVGTFVFESVGRVCAPEYFPPVEKSHCAVSLVEREEWEVPRHRLRKGLMEGVKLDVYFPGFPTLKHIRHTGHLARQICATH